MSKFYFFALALLLAACLSEKNIDPAKSSTFTRYFSDGYVNDPIAIEETPDKGFIILINSNLKNSDADLERERILLIKTDQFGNEVWTKYFPDETISISTRWKGNSIALLPSGGYLITGEEIQVGGSYRTMLLLKVMDNGDTEDSKVYSSPYFPYSLTARAAVVAPATSGLGDNFMVVAYSPDLAVLDNILVTEINSTSLDTVWTRTYKGGSAALTNKIFYHPGATPFIYWGGDWEESATNIASFVTKSKLDAAGTENGQTVEIGTPDARDFGLDFCEKGEGFGFVGYKEKGAQLGDIFFCPVSSDGIPGTPIIYTKEIFANPGAIADGFNVKEEKGNAITATKDGGFMILGTIDTYTNLLGRGNTDLLLLKIDGFGGKEWSTTFGSPDVDTGISIKQTSDGGYVVLGATRLAALRTVLMIKTDKNGKID